LENGPFRGKWEKLGWTEIKLFWSKRVTCSRAEKFLFFCLHSFIARKSSFTLTLRCLQRLSDVFLVLKSLNDDVFKGWGPYEYFRGVTDQNSFFFLIKKPNLFLNLLKFLLVRQWLPLWLWTKSTPAKSTTLAATLLSKLRSPLRKVCWSNFCNSNFYLTEQSTIKRRFPSCCSLWCFYWHPRGLGAPRRSQGWLHGKRYRKSSSTYFSIAR
jgi:hypothetical protein